jgi:hypothetical protein
MMPKQLRNGSDRRGKLGGHHFCFAKMRGYESEQTETDGGEIE